MQTYRPNGDKEFFEMPQGAVGFRVERITLDNPLARHSDLITLTIGLHRTSEYKGKSVPLNSLIDFTGGMRVITVRYGFAPKNLFPSLLALSLQYADPLKSMEFINIGASIEGDFIYNN